MGLNSKMDVSELDCDHPKQGQGKQIKFLDTKAINGKQRVSNVWL